MHNKNDFVRHAVYRGYQMSAIVILNFIEWIE